MAYSAQADFLKRIKKTELDKLIAVSAGDGLTTSDILDEAIDTADSLIDSYLTGKVSTLPIDTPSKVIVQASCDIAIYNLHSRIQNIDIPEWVTTRYQNVMNWLKDISRGHAQLEASAVATETVTDFVDYDSDRDPVFSPSTF